MLPCIALYVALRNLRYIQIAISFELYADLEQYGHNNDVISCTRNVAVTCYLADGDNVHPQSRM